MGRPKKYAQAEVEAEPTKESRKEQRGGELPSSYALRVHRAEEMLRAFASVGATAFDLTCTTVEGTKAVFRKSRPFPLLTAQLPVILETADKRQWNVIIRPHPGEGTTIVQLDDLDREKLSRVEDLAFLTFETSPGSFQAWVSVAGSSETLIRRCRQGAGADVHASGATRICGSRNIKPKHAPDFPTVALVAVRPGLTVTEAELDRRGLLAPEERREDRPPFAPSAERKRGRDKKIPPSIERCLASAPAARNHDGKDRSHADFEYALIAADRGFTPVEVAELLMQVSEKAAGEGKRYAEFTAKRAAEIVQNRRGQ